MINSQFKLRVERAIQLIHDDLRTRILQDGGNYTDVLKETQSCYLTIDAGADWNCTFGLMDPLYEEHNHTYGSFDECIFTIILRHKTDPGLFVDIVTKVITANGQYMIDNIPNSLVCNMQTHVEYEAVLAAVGAINTYVKTSDFASAKVVFRKRIPT